MLYHSVDNGVTFSWGLSYEPEVHLPHHLPVFALLIFNIYIARNLSVFLTVDRKQEKGLLHHQPHYCLTLDLLFLRNYNP